MRKFGLKGLLFGKNILRIPAENGAEMLNVFMKYGIVYSDFGEDGEGGIVFSVTPAACVLVKRLCREKNISLKTVSEYGAPHLIYLIRKRWGLVLGAVLAIFIIAVSDNYVWDIKLEGNETVTYSYVVKKLDECGLRVGSRLSELDVDKIETLVLLGSDKISWITVNIVGTSANVQIREVQNNIDPPEKKPCNVVASRDGVIEYLEVFKGEAAVKEGEAVRKGDLLISGVRDSNAEGLVLTTASGKVFAITEREFLIIVPLEYSKKTIIDTENIEKSLIFFSKEIKIFKNYRKNTSICDTIDTVEVLRFFGGVKLPFGVRTVRAVIAEDSTGRYSGEEAMEIAYYRLAREIEAELADAEILRKTVEAELREDSYVIKCRVRCIENIGETAEIELG